MTKSKLHNALLAVTLAGGLFAGAGSAYATPGTVFQAFNLIEFDTTSVVPADEFQTISTGVLEWREGATPTSFLRIISPPSNTNVNIVSDSNVWVDIAQIQHENNVIPGGSFAYTVDVLNAFTLTGAAFDAVGGGDTLATILGVAFLETLNQDNPADCDQTSNPLGSTCDDTFTIDGLNEVLNTFLFSALGERWALSIRILAEEAEGSFFDGNDTIFTAEDFTSNIFFQARIDQLEVPEPATLALLGIGLLGLPFVRRRATKEAEPLAG